MFMLAVFIPVFIVVVLGAVHFIPLWNTMIFDRIWQDPAIAARAKAMKRMKDIYADGLVPEETALMLAEKEMGVSEKEIMESLGALNKSDLKGMLTGKRNGFGEILDGIDNVFKRGLK